MGDAVKKTISLPPDLAEDAERVAKEEGKSLSAVIQDALRLSRRHRLSSEWEEMQGDWSAPAGARRVVFDSHVRRAALLSPEGHAAAAVENILDGKDDLVLSPPILREILSVL